MGRDDEEEGERGGGVGRNGWVERAAGREGAGDRTVERDSRKGQQKGAVERDRRK